MEGGRMTPVLAKTKRFTKGDRVVLSYRAFIDQIHTWNDHWKNRVGTVNSTKLGPMVSVKWDGNKHPCGYHRSFIELQP
jgi:hypothetical protein